MILLFCYQQGEMLWWRVLQTEFKYSVIDLSPGGWLTGNLINDQAESAILSDKQTRQESRLMSVDLNLKNGVYWQLSQLKQETFWCSFMFIVCYRFICVALFDFST